MQDIGLPSQSMASTHPRRVQPGVDHHRSTTPTVMPSSMHGPTGSIRGLDRSRLSETVYKLVSTAPESRRLYRSVRSIITRCTTITLSTETTARTAPSAMIQGSQNQGNATCRPVCCLTLINMQKDWTCSSIRHADVTGTESGEPCGKEPTWKRGEQLYRPSFAERGELHFGVPRLIEAFARTGRYCR